ncbi:hypothetical protein WMY93_034208 [Mugilogobius chulae]|uniref:Myb-like domain-containing protein n=1 Tax=Mugilogobius chulae TaxID=88201 RepID=A0AAW0MF45_9GOBI
MRESLFLCCCFCKEKTNRVSREKTQKHCPLLSKRRTCRFRTTEETRALIDWRTANEGLFTGRRNSSKNGWEDFVTSSGLPISATQAKKKWQNLVQKRSSVIHPLGKGGGWWWYVVLDAALQGQHSISPPLVEASSAATAGGMVTPPASVAEASEASADQGPEGSRGRKRQRESLLEFLKERAEREEERERLLLEREREAQAREEERERAATERAERYLALFERLVNKF